MLPVISLMPVCVVVNRKAYIKSVVKGGINITKHLPMRSGSRLVSHTISKACTLRSFRPLAYTKDGIRRDTRVSGRESKANQCWRRGGVAARWSGGVVEWWGCV